MKINTLVLILLAFAGSALAAGNNPPAGGPPSGPGGNGHEGPCKEVVQACQAAGFVQGGVKNGNGLWRDCVDPLIQGVTTVPGATKPLPSVPAGAISACKAHHPKFGEGKVGGNTPPPAGTN